MSQIYRIIVVAGVLLALQSTASAQTPGLYSGPRSRAFSRPTYSPYLNLLRRGNSTTFNYYALVRPELEFRAANEQFQGNFGELQTQFDRFQRGRAAASNLGTSGHRARFFVDYRGGVGSVPGTLGKRNGLLSRLPPIPSSRLAPTGHGAYFNNLGSYFPNRGIGRR